MEEERSTKKAKGAHYRIRVEKNAATLARDAEKEWLDPKFILDCVEADRLLDSEKYVITPAREVEFERVMTREEAAPILELESCARDLLKKQKNKELFKKNGKSLVFHIRVEKENHSGVAIFCCGDEKVCERWRRNSNKQKLR